MISPSDQQKAEERSFQRKVIVVAVLLGIVALGFIYHFVTGAKP
ncbi:hypothetical protein BH11PLA2_BH11PLA2_52720 [soil metagenome]